MESPQDANQDRIIWRKGRLLHQKTHAFIRKLGLNISEIARYVQDKPKEFDHLSVDIQYRYQGEILSNRNGTSPNKPVKNFREVHEPCLEPLLRRLSKNHQDKA